MYLSTTTTITAPSLCRINIKNNVLDITTSMPKMQCVWLSWSELKRTFAGGEKLVLFAFLV